MTLEEYRQGVARQKRDAVLDAALRLFLKNGYDRTPIEAVAREAGVSSATVYKHFRSKADLFGGIMERFWQNGPDDNRPPAPEPGDPRAGLTAIGRHYAMLLRDSDTAPLFRVIIAEVSRFPELGERLYEVGKLPYLERLRAYLASEVEAGALHIDDVKLAKRQFLGMINDLLFWPGMLIAGFEVDDAHANRVVDEAVETFLARYGTRETR